MRGGGARGSPRGGAARAPRGAEGDSARFVALRRRRGANKARRRRRRASRGGARLQGSILAEVGSPTYPLPKQAKEEEASPSPKLTLFGPSLLLASPFLLHWGVGEGGRDSGKTRMPDFSIATRLTLDKTRPLQGLGSIFKMEQQHRAAHLAEVPEALMK